MPSDMTDLALITTLVQTVLRNHPTPRVLVNNAGIMQAEDLTADPASSAVAQATPDRPHSTDQRPAAASARTRPNRHHQRHVRRVDETGGVPFDWPTW